MTSVADPADNKIGKYSSIELDLISNKQEV